MAKRSTSKKTAKALDASCRVVILHGKDRFLQDLHLGKLRKALAETHGGGDEDGIDVIRFEGGKGGGVNIADVLDEARSMGLMAAHKLIVVDDADEFVKEPSDGASAGMGGSKTPRQMMEAYAAEPCEGATLVLRAQTWRAGKLDKAVEQVGAVIKCDEPTPGEAVKWAMARCSKRYGAALEARAAQLLVERIGTDLGQLDSTIGKLAAMSGGNPVTADLVADQVGATREEAFWTIQESLLRGDAGRAIGHLRELVTISRHDPIAITWAYMDLARKLHGAARGAEQGMNAGQVAGMLKLWGPARDLVLGACRRRSGDAWAGLLDEAVRTDAANKSGFGEPVRNLETLTVRFTSLCGR